MSSSKKSPFLNFGYLQIYLLHFLDYFEGIFIFPVQRKCK